MAKKPASSGTLTVKGLSKLVQSTHQATIVAAKAARKAFQSAGINHLHVVVPGEVGQIKAPNFKKRVASSKE